MSAVSPFLSTKSRRSREYVTIAAMIRIYCHNKHKSKKQLCDDCRELLVYAHSRLESCQFADNKPTCAACSIHCYKPQIAEKIRGLMHFSGPRMVYWHPYLALRHLIDKLKNNKKNG